VWLGSAFVHRALTHDEKVCGEVFEALGADPLYRRLCSHQKCFRARLTPKPWRCDVPNPPTRWPFDDDHAAARFKKWEQEYLGAANGYATCHLVAQIGAIALTPEIAELITVHDDVSRCGSGLPLA
jgi:hypothetical protein